MPSTSAATPGQHARGGGVPAATNAMPRHGRDVHDAPWMAASGLRSARIALVHDPYAAAAAPGAVVVHVHLKGLPREALVGGAAGAATVAALQTLLRVATVAGRADGLPALALAGVLGVDALRFTADIAVLVRCGGCGGPAASAAAVAARLSGTVLFDRAHVWFDAAASAAGAPSAALAAYGNMAAELPQRERHWALDGLPHRAVVAAPLRWAAESVIRSD